jgi:hypothetical protein
MRLLYSQSHNGIYEEMNTLMLEWQEYSSGKWKPDGSAIPTVGKFFIKIITFISLHNVFRSRTT